MNLYYGTIFNSAVLFSCKHECSMPISGRKIRVERRAASQRDFVAFMSDSLLSSFPVGSSSGSTGWGFAYKKVSDYGSSSSIISLPNEAKSFILLNITYATQNMTYVNSFGFTYENYSGTDYSRPLYLNRKDTKSFNIQIYLMTSSSSTVERHYVIRNSTSGISITPPNIQSGVYSWGFHFLVLPYELTSYT